MEKELENNNEIKWVKKKKEKKKKNFQSKKNPTAL